MTKKDKSKGAKSFLDIFKMADRFGETMSFTVADRKSFPSVFGTLVSLTIFAYMLMYGFKKFTVMQTYSDTKF